MRISDWSSDVCASDLLLLRGEMRVERFAGLPLCVPLRHAGQGVGPGQRGAFAGRVDRRFVPGGEQIDALFGLARGARIDAVHIDAVGAAVEDRRDRKSTL